MFKIAIVPTGRTTKAGKPIFKAAPTKTSIKRAVSAKRVQTFGSGGRKISDTQRVKVTIGGVEKFVTPERALALSKEGSRQFIEAQQKKAEIARLTETEIKKAGFDIEKITARQDSQREKVAKLIIAEQRARGTKAEALFKQRRIEEQAKLGKIEREKAVLVQFTTAAGRAVIQVQVEPKKIREPEVIEPKKPLELFSEEARERLGLGETAQGLLTITEVERKKIIERGEIRADIPTSAEFRTGFEKFVGKGFKEEDLFGLKTPTGVLTFKTIFEPVKEKLELIKEFEEEKIRPISREIVVESPFEIQQALARLTLEDLKGKKGIIPSIQRTILETKVVSLEVPTRIFQQFREEPVESAFLFGTGALTAGGLGLFGLTKAPIVIKSAIGLQTLFATAVAFEAGLQVGVGDFEEAVGITTERITEAGLFVGGGLAASSLIQAIKPSRVRVLKVKELKTALAETLETKGTSAKNLQRIGLRTEVKTRVTRFRRGIQTRIIKTPKDPAKLAKLLEDPRVRFEFRIIEGTVKQVLVREIPPTIVRPEIKPEAFEIRVDGKLGLRLRDVTISTDLFDIKVGEVKGIVDVKGLKRVIDPTLFKKIGIKGLPKDLTVLQRDFISDIDKLPFDVRAELIGLGRITGKVKPVRRVADIFGIDLFPPQVVTDFTTIGRLGFKPILGVSPLFEPPPVLLFPTGLLDLFGRREGRVREPILDVTRDIARISGVTPVTISESITKKDVISDIAQIAKQVREGRRITKPIVDLGLAEAQLPIVDVLPKRRQEVALRVPSDLKTDLIIDIIKEPKPKKKRIRLPKFKRREERIKGRFEGYNAFVRGRKGKQLKVNLKRTLTKKSALSTSARVIDTSLSATGSIKKAISKNPPIDTKDNYFQRNRNKFRTFRIRKGKRIPLKDKIIERRKFRLDTKQEVNKIQAAKRISQVRKRLLKFEIFEEPKKKKRRRRQTVRFF